MASSAGGCAPRWPGSRPTPELAGRLRAAVGGGLVARVQALLGARGYPAGPADGVIGPKTRAALAAYRREGGAAAVAGFDQLAARLAAEAEPVGAWAVADVGCDEAPGVEFLVTLDDRSGLPVPSGVRPVTPEEFLAWWRACRGRAPPAAGSGSSGRLGDTSLSPLR